MSKNKLANREKESQKGTLCSRVEYGFTKDYFKYANSVGTSLKEVVLSSFGPIVRKECKGQLVPTMVVRRGKRRMKKLCKKCGKEY